jgi:hypothetical protein
VKVLVGGRDRVLGTHRVDLGEQPITGPDIARDGGPDEGVYP